ncbi:hypothetical protein F4604DRAFT_1959067 [Suillus subluteus]|nr:hypothetical protein F4604DRAFT_1959067 [Suillus subluteus]
MATPPIPHSPDRIQQHASPCTSTFSGTHRPAYVMRASEHFYIFAAFYSQDGFRYLQVPKPQEFILSHADAAPPASGPNSSLSSRTKLEHILIVENSPPLPRPPYRSRRHQNSPTYNMSIILTDADAHMLALHGPHLYSISLGNHNTPVSLGALGYIVGSCRELCEISLYVDARLDAFGTAFLDDDEQVSLQPNRRLTKLDIGELPIACVSPLDPPTAPEPLWCPSYGSCT